MKTKFPKASVCFLFMQMLIAPATAQEVKEYVTKTNAEKIKKEIQVLQAPITAGGFGDGHGKSPVLTDRTHVPDTFALVSFYINDVGTVREGPYSISSYWITPEGGNIVANQLEKQVMASLKESFQKQGVILLTPSEFLDTPQKQKYYYETFVPKVSKLAKFLSNIETKNVDTSVGADHYRPFDITVAWDPIRSESLVTDLGKKLGLKGIATLAFDIQTDRKDIFLLSARLALQGPNPIPKEDKKYVAQNMGNGYYYGQVFTDVNFRIPRPALIGQYYNIKKAAKKDVVRTGGLYQQTVTSKQGADIGLDPSGLETIVALLTEKTFDTIQESIEKAASKYRKK